MDGKKEMWNKNWEKDLWKKMIFSLLLRKKIYFSGFNKIRSNFWFESVCVWKCEKEKKDNVNTISSQFLSKSKQFYLRNRNFVGGVLGGGFRNVKYQWFE